MERHESPSASDAEDSQPLLSAYEQELPDHDPPAYPATETHPQPPDYQPVATDNTLVDTKPSYGPVAPGTVIYQQPMRVIASPQEIKPSAVGAITFSCIIFWCCCFPFGLIAFIFAVLAAQSRTAVKAARHIRLSHAMSCAGLISGIVLTLLSLRGPLRAIWKIAEFEYVDFHQTNAEDAMNTTLSMYSY